MKLGLLIGYSPARVAIDMDRVHEAERLGFDAAWTAEAYGSDAVSPAAWILALTQKIRVGTAIMQMPARSPASTAMTAMTLHGLSGGRFILGLGPSGPQVVEGHGSQIPRRNDPVRVNILAAHSYAASIDLRPSAVCHICCVGHSPASSLFIR